MTQYKHMAEYLMPGSFMSEETTLQLPERSLDAALNMAPDRAFAFTLYDTAIVDFEFDAALFTVIPIGQNKSGTYYIDAEILDVDMVRALPGDHRTLIANMEGNGWDRVVRCRTGNFQPLEPGDHVVSTSAVRS